VKESTIFVSVVMQACPGTIRQLNIAFTKENSCCFLFVFFKQQQKAMIINKKKINKVKYVNQ
jgi:hypothetical protein